MSLAWRLSSTPLTLVPYPVTGSPPPGSSTVHRWLIQDHLGSAVLVVSAAGTVVHRRVFEPYGQVHAQTTPSEPTRQLFTDQEYSAGAQLYDFDARWYDGGIGRFAGTDPVIRDLWSPQSVNAFSYVENRPMTFSDPTGEFLEGIGNIAVGFFSIAIFWNSSESWTCLGVCGGGPPGGPPPGPPDIPQQVAVPSISVSTVSIDIDGFDASGSQVNVEASQVVPPIVAQVEMGELLQRALEGDPEVVEALRAGERARLVRRIQEARNRVKGAELALSLLRTPRDPTTVERGPRVRVNRPNPWEILGKFLAREAVERELADAQRELSAAEAALRRFDERW